MAALIGALRVSLSADTANFDAGMRRAQSTASNAATGIQKSLGGLKAAVSGFVGALSVGLFVNVIKNALEYAGSLGEVSQQLGVTTKDLQTFRYAAGQVGVSQETLETGLSKLTITLGKVAAGAEAPTKALNAIGISVDQIKGKDTGAAFRIIADGLEKVTDRSQRAAIEVALFGKSGAQLDNLLSGGSSALDELTSAAERLGIVLTDEQIQRADDTADKLEALKTVLSANIAGAVADNADAILTLGSAIASLIGSIGPAIQGLRQLWAEFQAGAPFLALGPAGLPLYGAAADKAANDARIKAFVFGPQHNQPVHPVAAPRVGSDISPFLAGGGGRKKRGGGRADHSAEQALREEQQFDQDMRRAKLDTLRAQQDLAKDYTERTTISIQILDAEKASRESELQYQVALYALTKGKQGMSQSQADQLRAQEKITDSLEREKLLQDEQEQRQRDVQQLIEHDFDRRKDVLDSQSAIATTAAERRKIELELLEIAYEQKRQALQNTVDTSKDEAAREDARRDLLNLNQTHANDRQGVINSTRGPLEEWAASIPKTAAEMNEALEEIQTQGLQGLSDAIADVVSGTGNLKDAFKSLASSVISDIVRMTIKMMLFRTLSGLGRALGGLGGSASVSISSADGAFSPTSTLSNFDFGSLPHMARGGSFRVGGFGGTDRNVLSVNGIPRAMVSGHERVNVGNDNVNGGLRVQVVKGDLFDVIVDKRAAAVAQPMMGQGAIMGAAGAEERSARRARRSIP